ncbi:alkaline phosphatase D family protein [Oxalobacteraceae bacterium]|nr:alkaline phosphatase D family protein [Oxalobacteraceae bacterium]
MDRRQFLKFGSFITVSVAAVGIPGCGGSSTHSDPALPSASGSDWKFPQSVASGDPRADSILLWTRAVAASSDGVAPATGADVAIRVLVTDADNGASLGSNKALSGTLVVDTTVPLKSAFDNTVRHKVTGLTAGRTYYYQFIAGDVRSNVGRFKTAPAADADVASLQFAYMSCQDWSINHWGAHAHIAANENLDFIVFLGDYIYETVGEAFQTGAVETRHDQLVLPDGAYKSGSSGAKYAITLADYRYLYKKYRSDARLQAVHERFAFITVWDDHEFSDDAWQDAQTYAGTFNADGSDLHQPARRRSANQAWFEFMPADVSLDTADTGFQNIKIYRDFQFGKLMQLVMTDERLYRADHIIPEAAINPATGKPVGSIGARYLVPQALFDSVEAQKMAGGVSIGADPLSIVGMLGTTQREWWKDKMKSATATWKLWGNEVSLLRMGLDGTNAIATLLALNSITPLATSVGTTAAAVGGNLPLAAAIVAAATAGAASATAQAGGVAIAGAAASGAAAQGAAGVGAGLSASQAGIAVAAFGAATAAAAGGASAQAAAAGQTIAFGLIKPEIQANGAKSSFLAASGKAAALAPFFAKFLLNCDQWDGYNSERKALMAHLKTNNVSNVVALTGDIHSFFAGTVSDDFDAANGGTPVMVDLVSAGVSSDSFFSYIKAEAESLGDIATLVSYPLPVPVPGVGTVNIAINLLDYTMGKAVPTVDTLGEQIRVQLRGGLAAKGVPEAQLDATTTAVLAGVKASSDFSVTLLGLAKQLAGLGNNPWIKHLNTDAQGYAVVTLTPGKLVTQFKQVNKLVGGSAPTSVIARVTTATVEKGAVAVSIS